jgi:small-conductance mechanosensitive channel
VPAGADALLRRLEDTQPGEEVESSVEEIARSLPQVDGDLNAALERATDAIKRSALPGELEDIRREVLHVTAPLGDWKDELAAEAQRVTEALAEITRDERVWSQTRERPETVAAGDVVLRRVESSIEALDAAGASLRKWQARIIAASDRVFDRVAAADAALEMLQTATVRERTSLLVPDRPPLWSRGSGAAMHSELSRVPEEIRTYAESTATYAKRDLRPLIVHALVAAFLMFTLGRFSSRALKRLAGDEAAARAARLLERPYSIALLLALIASPLFHPLAPRRFMQLVVMIALFPAARIVTHASGRGNLGAFAGLFVLLLLDRVGLALQPLPALERATLLLTLGVGFGLAFWVARRFQPSGDAPWLRRAAKLAMWGLSLALLAEIGGWTYLATLLGRGILASAIAALYLYAAGIALAALLAYGLASHTVRRSYLLGRNTAVLQRRAERGLRWFGVGLWLYFMATALGLRSTAADTLGRLLGAGVSVGALSLSVGGVLGFVLTLLGAFLLARIVTSVLEEDVYPRTHLPRGVPYALSTLVRYGVYSLGFFFALAAAGVQLSQVSIMIGGLGIGIGLGLQDLVKNFAAGLTLLLERRVHVGDALELPSQGIIGRVLSIGMRASVIRTWSGAEVVVPNGDLISSAVTNWTLSDRLYRVEVPVGVAYGTDPERVIALLLDAVRSDDQLLTDPAPQALFKGFGDSSLDFVVRAWTDQGYDNALSLTSRLGLAVHRTLEEAGIVIPFPQRDLHVVSVSPHASAALSGRERPD